MCYAHGNKADSSQHRIVAHVYWTGQGTADDAATQSLWLLPASQGLMWYVQDKSRRLSGSFLGQPHFKVNGVTAAKLHVYW